MIGTNSTEAHEEQVSIKRLSVDVCIVIYPSILLARRWLQRLLQERPPTQNMMVVRATASGTCTRHQHCADIG